MGSIGRFALQAWIDLDQDPEHLALIGPSDGEVVLPSPLAVAELAFDSVAVASLAATLVASRRDGVRPRPFRLSGDRVTTAFQSERHIRIDDEPPAIWAPLSGFWRTDTGWVRTHGNYEHHALALRAVLGLGADADRGAIEAAFAARRADELEEQAAARGAVLAAVRPAHAWGNHPHARALSRTSMVNASSLGEAPARGWTHADRPLEGIRVLDLTRVIAGPVCTRTLAYLGAEVLRIDSPRMAEPQWQHSDTGAQKRSALLDFATSEGQRQLHDLLAEADVLVHGYRPGTLTAFGLSIEELEQRHPGLVVAQVSAWGLRGPWSERRGFDSIVQAATGIAMAHSADGHQPGAMPAQALDHSAGYFLAAAVCLGLLRQREWGGTHHADVALARIAAELLATPGSSSGGTTPEPTLQTEQTPIGAVTAARPAVEFPDADGRFRALAGGFGADEAVWTRSAEVVQ